jgi:transcriptional regulator with XRE-family HTH domain
MSATMIAMELHKKLKRLCDAKGLNQTDVMRITNASKGTASNWMKGKPNGGTAPDLESALKLARALGVPLDYLADDDMDEPPSPPRTLDPADALFLSTVKTLGFTYEQAIDWLHKVAKPRESRETGIGYTDAAEVLGGGAAKKESEPKTKGRSG